MSQPALDAFTPQVREWFGRAFAEPTAAQAQAWPAIATGAHTLISAPTGSGKTLAAFLWALDRLVAEPSSERTRLVYVSPLKALSYDVEKNLRAPLRGIGADVRVGIRTGDTPQKDRRDMVRHPPDILITTPESLYLMLTSQAREIFADAEQVIVDEIHAVAQTKRGAHLAITLERLAEQAGRDLQRIGLSATQNPLEEVGRFLVGPKRTCTIVDTGTRKPLDLKIHVPVESMVEPEQSDLDLDPFAGQEATRKSIWPAIYPELLKEVRAHRSTIIFVNNRRAAERLALRLNELAEASGDAAGSIARAHHGSLAREERLVVEEQLKAGELPCLVATSSLELGIDMGAVDLVLQVESPKSVTAGLQRIGRSGHGVGDTAKGRIFPKFRADLLECAVVARRMREGLIERTVVPRNPLDVLAQQIVAIAASRRDRRRRRAARAGPAHALVRRALARAARERARHARRPLPVGGVRRAAAADRLGPRRRHDPRAQGRPRAGDHQRRHDPRPRPVLRQPARRPARRRARRGDGLRGAPRARSSCSARRAGGSRRSRATASSSRPRPACRARCRSGRATASGARASWARRSARSRAGRSSRTPRRSPTATTSTRSPRRTCSPSCASSRTPRASSRATARSSSSASATRSATGACASSRPTAAACTPPGASR